MKIYTLFLLASILASVNALSLQSDERLSHGLAQGSNEADSDYTRVIYQRPHYGGYHRHVYVHGYHHNYSH